MNDPYGNPLMLASTMPITSLLMGDTHRAEMLRVIRSYQDAAEEYRAACPACNPGRVHQPVADGATSVVRWCPRHGGYTTFEVLQ